MLRDQALPLWEVQGLWGLVDLTRAVLISPFHPQSQSPLERKAAADSCRSRQVALQPRGAAAPSFSHPPPLPRPISNPLLPELFGLTV